MPSSTNKTAEPDEAAVPPAYTAPELKYTLVVANIPLGQSAPGQLAWIEESAAAEFIACGFASKVLRKDTPADVPPAP